MTLGSLLAAPGGVVRAAPKPVAVAPVDVTPAGCWGSNAGPFRDTNPSRVRARARTAGCPGWRTTAILQRAVYVGSVIIAWRDLDWETWRGDGAKTLTKSCSGLGGTTYTFRVIHTMTNPVGITFPPQLSEQRRYKCQGA